MGITATVIVKKIVNIFSGDPSVLTLWLIEVQPTLLKTE